MLTLNFLPPEQKQELTYERNRRVTVFVGAVLLFQLFIFCLLLVSIYFYIVFQSEGLVRQVEVEKAKVTTKKSRELELSVSQIKKNLETLVLLQDQRRPVAGILEHAASLVPEGIALKSISLKKDTKEMTFAGRAATRAALLNFKDILERSSAFKGVNVPIATLLRQTDIDFNLNVTLP